jgi:SAM-dependent methyltransferase
MLTVEFDELKLGHGRRILDAGCGNGRHLCEAYRLQGPVVVGTDLRADECSKSKTMLKLMDKGQAGWLVMQSDLANLPCKDASFDIVICSEVLEHINDHLRVIKELARVLKEGGDMVITVPRFLPEAICWILSKPYRSEPGGHVKIFRKDGLKRSLEMAGLQCRRISYRHALHSPYWWIRCLVGHKNEEALIVKYYRLFLEWDIKRHHPLVALIEGLLNPLIGKSIVYYLKKGSSHGIAPPA